MIKLNLPTKEECKLMIDITFRVPTNIVDHMIQVNRVANFIAKKLKEKGEDINIELVDRASILHDCMKVVDIPAKNLVMDPSKGSRPMKMTPNDRKKWMELREKYAGFSHEEATYMAFRERYPEMAEIIRHHGYSDFTTEKSPKTWEGKIVNYADKRVKHSDIVTLKERFRDGHKRYAQHYHANDLDVEKVDKQYEELERKIFEIIGTDPDKIEKDIENWEKNDRRSEKKDSEQ